MYNLTKAQMYGKADKLSGAILNDFRHYVLSNDIRLHHDRSDNGKAHWQLFELYYEWAWKVILGNKKFNPDNARDIAMIIWSTADAKKMALRILSEAKGEQ